MAANASLAALYRPQTFAEVVGQDMVKSILSRAAREDRVAPAYLLSGTRGVGKPPTTSGQTGMSTCFSISSSRQSSAFRPPS